MSDSSLMMALWWAVIASGIYHGVNPGMGWPLAVSSALMERRKTAIVSALGSLAFGHFLAMTVILMPFSLLTELAPWTFEIRIGAGILVVALGVYLLLNQRHPRLLARVQPSKLVLWSFLAATVHGAGLMLVPIFLGLCGPDMDSGHAAAQTLMATNLTTAMLVAVLHTLAMTTSGAVLASAMYFWLGLKFLSHTWFNLDTVWALSLIVVGVLGIASVPS